MRGTLLSEAGEDLGGRRHAVQVERNLALGVDARDGAVDHAEAADAQKRTVGARNLEVAVDQQRGVELIFRGEAPMRFGVAVVDAVDRYSGCGVAIAVSTDRGELSLSTRGVVHRIKDEYDRAVPDRVGQADGLAGMGRQREIGSEIADSELGHAYPPSSCASAASSVS
jgi:hypothetical protein